MRPIWLKLVCALLILPMGGCGSTWPQPWVEPTGIAAAADVASIVVLHRGIFDTLFSTASGRDCSIVYLDRGQS